MTMIIGGISSLERFYTELLEYETFETEEIEPILISYNNIGLFVVEEGFCSKKWKNNPEQWFKQLESDNHALYETT